LISWSRYHNRNDCYWSAAQRKVFRTPVRAAHWCTYIFSTSTSTLRLVKKASPLTDARSLWLLESMLKNRSELHDIRARKIIRCCIPVDTVAEEVARVAFEINPIRRRVMRSARTKAIVTNSARSFDSSRLKPREHGRHALEKLIPLPLDLRCGIAFVGFCGSGKQRQAARAQGWILTDRLRAHRAHHGAPSIAHQLFSPVLSRFRHPLFSFLILSLATSERFTLTRGCAYSISLFNHFAAIIQYNLFTTRCTYRHKKHRLFLIINKGRFWGFTNISPFSRLARTTSVRCWNLKWKVYLMKARKNNTFQCVQEEKNKPNVEILIHLQSWNLAKIDNEIKYAVSL